MSRDAQLLSANDTNVVFQLTNSHAVGVQTYVIAATGTFGGGTIALTISYDKGVTYTNLNDPRLTAATPLTFTAAGYTPELTLNSDAEWQVRIKAAISGATNPSVTIAIFNGS